MIKKILLIALIIIPLQIAASNGGIQFFHGTYEEAMAKADQEDKLVFIDWVTEWCGPCKMMARDVFPLPEVGAFYNEHFVSVKLDAESSQYSALAKSFKVASYPTYLFINPRSGKVVHRSGSRQSTEDFMLTGKQANSLDYNSVNLMKRYSSGDRGKELLEQYVIYLKSMGKRKELRIAYDEYLALPGVELSAPTAWRVFVSTITGIDNKYFREVYASQEIYQNAFGEAVDGKIEKELSLHIQRAAHGCLYGGGQEAIDAYYVAHDQVREYSFSNKDLVLKQAHAIFLLSQTDYNAMHELVTSVLFDERIGYELKAKYFNQFIGYAYAVKDDINYLNKMLVYARYFAYNVKDMNDVRPHFKYAEVLEKILRQSAIDKDLLYTEEPPSGIKTYSLRPKDLKQKPKKQSK